MRVSALQSHKNQQNRIAFARVMWVVIILLIYVAQSHVMSMSQRLALHVAFAKVIQFLWFLLYYKDNYLLYNTYNKNKIISVGASAVQSARFWWVKLTCEHARHVTCKPHRMQARKSHRILMSHITSAKAIQFQWFLLC